MQFKTLLSLLPLVAAVLGYVVPEDTPDGFYAVTFDEHGNSTTHQIDPSTLATIGEPLEKRGLLQPSTKHLHRRQTPKSYSGTGKTFPVHSDYDQCTIEWRNFFKDGKFVPKHTIYYLTVGQAVLAGCNYQSTASFGPKYPFVDNYNAFMDANVGYWRTGWAHYSPGFDFTFWRDFKGTALCTSL
ncbi:hypothetical protein QBC36DRAFT_359322 [Triangularia setosa]|uniref:Uncharacterized protein n=1 Tax=Triangularia setosa TaxID=2587417 RepID=A0AAN6W1K7_9PEZI|nr:hypothetical protein QBC36DRAFT_359322 [Podospora setosa]